MEAGRLEEIIRRFPDCRVAVLGDFFLDKYLDTDPELAQVSVESGKTAHQVVSIRTSAGAAGTIVNNLKALDAGELHTLGVTGDDGEGYELRKCLDAPRLRHGRSHQCSRFDDPDLSQAQELPGRRPLGRARALRHEKQGRHAGRGPGQGARLSREPPAADRRRRRPGPGRGRGTGGFGSRHEAGQDAAGRIGRPVPR